MNIRILSAHNKIAAEIIKTNINTTYTQTQRNIKKQQISNAVEGTNTKLQQITTMVQRPHPKNSSRNDRMSETRQTIQPKPKFVAHKDPTKGKKQKAKKTSNRLGNHLHMV